MVLAPYTKYSRAKRGTFTFWLLGADLCIPRLSLLVGRWTILVVIIIRGPCIR